MRRKEAPMDETTCIVACETLKQELDLVMRNRNCSWPVIRIDAGKHARPDKLRASIQENLNRLPPARTVLLLFGFCGNAMVGIEAGTHTLILPRVADCIPLFIGSREERDSYGAGTCFFTEGYINSGGSIVSDTSRVIERYGEKRGLFILKKMLLHYRSFAVINTGTFNVADVQARVENFAKQVDIPVKVVPGSLRIIDALLAGGWQADAFLIVRPGGSVSFEDSLSAGRAQQGLDNVTDGSGERRI
jgi:hypothetical protein